ncbi:MAG: hypothetical protein RSD27_11325 [Ruthenibacterium sp.]
MTKKELSQLWYLNREIEQEQERIAQLRAAATDTSAKISGLPRGGGISDKTAIAALIADSDAIIRAKTQLCIVEYNRLNRYIASVEDSLTRQVLSLRYVDGLSWTAVAAHVGGGNTADSVRMAHNRFLHG